MGDDTHKLVCPFLDSSPEYARGVEFGILFERMKFEEEIIDLFLMENQDQILLLVNRLGWTVDTCTDASTPGWFSISMRRERK